MTLNKLSMMMGVCLIIVSLPGCNAGVSGSEEDAITEQSPSKDGSENDGSGEDDSGEDDSGEGDSGEDDSGESNCESGFDGHKGKQDYADQSCSSCHGDDGTGDPYPIDFEQYNGDTGIADFAAIIHSTMPTGDVDACVGDSLGECAYDIAEYLVTLQSCDNNIAPIANAGDDQIVDAGDNVELNGKNSSDEDGSIVSYQWQQVTNSGSAVVTLSNANSQLATFVAPTLDSAQELTFKLTVTDDLNDSHSDTVIIKVLEAAVVGNERPVVNAGDNQTASAQQTVKLSAQASDTDGEVVSYQWSLKSGPVSVSISNANKADASFTAPKYNQDIELVFEISVEDDQGASQSSTVTIFIEKYSSDGSCGELTFHSGYVDYTEQCAGCHGATNEGGVGGVIDLNKGLSTLASYTDLNMPPSDVSHCTGDDAGDCAYETIDYLMDLKACEPVAGQYANQTFTKFTPLKHLHKLTNSLSGRSPTTIEISAVQKDGESAIDNVVDDLLEEDAFYVRLKEIYNDMFLLAGREGNGNTEARVDRMYPNSTWSNDQFPDNKEKRTWANKASARSFLQDMTQLVNYLTREDKDYREFLTAPYVMANRYGALFMGATDVDLAQFTPIYTEQDVIDGNIDTELYPFAEDLVEDGKYALNYDPQEFHPITVPGKITSGALTSEMWYGRFLDTSTNRNRHRVYQMYKQFLDVDILGLTNVRSEDATDTDGIVYPVMESTSCVTCHSVLDPVGSLLQGWSYVNGKFTATYDAERTYDLDAFQAGFKGECVVMAGESTVATRWPTDGVTCSTYSSDEMTDGVPNPMLWLGKRIVQDEGFVRATVKRLFEGLFGEVPVRIASFDRASASAELLALEAVQKDYFDYWGQTLINSGYKMKTLIKEMVTSDYYAPASLKVSTLADDSLGAVNMRTPEMIRRRLLSEFDDDWNFRKSLYLLSADGSSLFYGSYLLYYGGIDSESVIVRTKDIESIKVAVQSQLGSKATCEGVYFDFQEDASQRILFPYIEIGEDSDAKLIQSIQYLFLTLHGRDLDSNHEEVTELVTYWKEFKSIAEESGGSNLYKCSEESENNFQQNDSTFTLQAWHTVIAALVDDFEYLFE